MKASTLALASICGTAFVGYCIYFDKKRRSHPDFLKNLAESKFFTLLLNKLFN